MEQGSELQAVCEKAATRFETRMSPDDLELGS